MAKNVLNLDEVPDVDMEVAIKIGGVEHFMVPMSVGSFIKQQRRADKLKGLKPADELDFMIDTIVEAFPTVPKKDLEKLQLRQLERIVEHVSDASKEAKENAPKGKPEKGA